MRKYDFNTEFSSYYELEKLLIIFRRNIKMSQVKIGITRLVFLVLISDVSQYIILKNLVEIISYFSLDRNRMNSSNYTTSDCALKISNEFLDVIKIRDGD